MTISMIKENIMTSSQISGPKTRSEGQISRSEGQISRSRAKWCQIDLFGTSQASVARRATVRDA